MVISSSFGYEFLINIFGFDSFIVSIKNISTINQDTDEN